MLFLWAEITCLEGSQFKSCCSGPIWLYTTRNPCASVSQHISMHGAIVCFCFAYLCCNEQQIDISSLTLWYSFKRNYMDVVMQTITNQPSFWACYRKVCSSSVTHPVLYWFYVSLHGWYSGLACSDLIWCVSVTPCLVSAVANTCHSWQFFTDSSFFWLIFWTLSFSAWIQLHHLFVR